MKNSAFILFFILALSQGAFANCDCANEDRHYPQVKFTGKVSSLSGHKDWALDGVTLDVEGFQSIEGLKDDAYVQQIKKRSQVVVDSFSHSRDCSVKFELGKRYLVVAQLINLGDINLKNEKTSRVMERWFTISCYGTREISN